jgi:hypothetical protein
MPENYFNYFTEIEERFQQRRGSILLLSTLDWALIETWKDAGIPLAAVLRGIDEAFDKYDRRPSKTRKVNSLAYCAQEVLAATESLNEAATGSDREVTGESTAVAEIGFRPLEIAAFLRRCEAQILAAAQKGALPQSSGVATAAIAGEVAASLALLAEGVATTPGTAAFAPRQFEDLERRLNVLEEKLLTALKTASPEDLLVALRAEADRELAPYRRKMPSAQVEQLMRQYLHKKLFEKYGLPRLSLFYL